MSTEFDPYYAWLGIPPKDQPPNHYRLLGVDLFEENLDVIESAAFRQMAHVRTYQGGNHASESQRLLNELSTARICLLNPEKRIDYDQRLQASVSAKIPDAAVPAQLPPPSMEAVQAADVVTEKSGPVDSVKAKLASVSTVRRSRPKPKSQISIVISVVVVVVCLGVVIMAGVMFLGKDKLEELVGKDKQEDPAVVERDKTTRDASSVEKSSTPSEVEPREVDPDPGSTNVIRPASPQRVTALNQTIRFCPSMPEQLRKMRLRVPLPAHIRKAIEANAGIASNDFLLVQTMPFSDL